MNQTFPECDSTAAAVDLMSMVNRKIKGEEEDRFELADMIMQGYYEGMKPVFAACSDKDIESLIAEENRLKDQNSAENDDTAKALMRAVDLGTKWSELEEMDADLADGETKSTDTVFQYLCTLNTYVRMRYEISAEMLRCIEEEGFDLSRKLKNKEISMEQLDMKEIGQRVVDRMAASDKSILKQANNLLEILNDNPVFSNVLKEAMNANGAGGK